MRSNRLAISSWFFCALTVAALASCAGDSSTGPPGGVSTVNVTPATDSIAIGGSVTLAAAALDASGHPVSGAKIFWNTENAQIATVSSNGTVTGITTGTVRIAASSSGVSGIATITVVPQAVASVRVTPLSAAVTVGGTVHLQAEPLDASGTLLTGRTITWSSANGAVASVDNTGLVTGVAVGATTISAESEGKAGTSGVAVGAQVAASITVAPPAVSITVAQTSQLTPTVRDANNAVISGAPVTWVVDNQAIALVSSTGLVTGVAAGGATVTAASGAAQITVPITVTPVPANAVIVSPSSVSRLVTERQQLSATVTDAQGNPLPGRTVTWGSSSNAIATVGTTGLVFAILPGTATITATSGGASGTSTITVSLVPVRNVVVTPDALALTVGDATQLAVTLQDSAGNTLSPTGHTVAWTSTNNGVATVTNAGLVTAIAPGPAVVSAKVDAQVGTATVTVAPVPVATVVVTPALDTLIAGASVQLSASPRDGNGNPLSGRAVTWGTSNSTVADVSSTGLVRTFSAGSATITATSEAKVGASTIVVLPVPVATVTVSPLTQSVVAGSTTPAFTATTKDGSGNTLTGRVVTWSSSDVTLATIDANTGVATGVAPGSVTITATSEGKTGTATLTVTAIPVATVTVAPTTQSVVAGSATPAFTATTKDGGGTVLTGRVVSWSSSDVTIATIDANTGVATGVAPGTVTITATSETKTGTATLTVTPVPVASVTVAPVSQSIVAGSATPAFTATTRDAANRVLTGRVVMWSSSSTSVATIDNNSGVATGVSPGTVTITATSEGKSGTASLTVTPVPVATVTVSPPTQSVVAGSATPAFTATTKDGGGTVLTGRVVTWSSSDVTIATIDVNTGVATGVAPGTVTITATSETKTGTASLTVTPVPVASVTVAPVSQSIVAGSATPAFTATTRDAANRVLTGRVVMWSSSSTSVATIDNNSGVATGVSPGTVTITATSEGKSGTASLTVTPVPVATVTVSPPTQSVVAGSTTPAFTATTKDGIGNTLTGRVVTWSSSDVTIATIDVNTGVATGVAPGSVTITATSETKTGTASLTVTPVPVATVAVSPLTQSVVAGSATPAFTATTKDGIGNTLTGRVVTWSSSDVTIATIDVNTGVATGVAPGTVTITATSETKTGTASLTVTPVPVASVTVLPITASVLTGATTLLTATPRDASNNPLTGRVVTWSSSNLTIATVNSTGLVTGVAPGSATITATSEGQSGSSVVTVLP